MSTINPINKIRKEWKREAGISTYEELSGNASIRNINFKMNSIDNSIKKTVKDEVEQLPEGYQEWKKRRE